MLSFGLVFLIISMGFVSTFFRKKLQLDLKADLPHYSAFILLNGVPATVFFFISAGFKIVINPIIIMFSLIYATYVILSLVIGFVSLKYNSILYSGIVGSAGGLIVSIVCGALFFGEIISGKLIFAASLMLAAILLPWIKNNSKAVKGLAVSTVIVCVIQFLMAGWGNVVLKWYTSVQGANDVNSFFFMTNVFMIIASIAALCVANLNGNFSIAKVKILLTARQVVIVIINTVLSNISSVLVVYALTMMDISLYTILTTSLGMIGSALISRFVFSEKVTIYDILATICAAGAIIISKIF